MPYGIHSFSIFVASHYDMTDSVILLSFLLSINININIYIYFEHSLKNGGVRRQEGEAGEGGNNAMQTKVGEYL